MLPQQMGYATRSLFSAVAPLTGESFHLIGFEAMDSDTECAFLTALQREHPNEHVVVVLDNAACHRRKDLRETPGLSLVFLPPYAPELCPKRTRSGNPIERFFEEIRRATANTVFAKPGDIEAAITNTVNR